MIPGNIDLTEKLDFRNVVKKELPQLPALWHENKINTEDINPGQIATYTTFHINPMEYTITSDEISDLYNYDTITQYSIISYDYRFNNDYVINTTEWRPRFSSTSTYISYSNNYNLDTTSSTNNNLIKIQIPYNEEKDVFGNVINNYAKDIPKIPWNSKESDYYSRITWEYCKSKRFDPSSYDHYDDIPWDEDDAEDKPRLYSEIDKAKHLISWLFDKSSTFIKNYFADDDTVLSYLTNMSWIRVRDAIID